MRANVNWLPPVLPIWKQSNQIQLAELLFVSIEIRVRLRVSIYVRRSQNECMFCADWVGYFYLELCDYNEERESTKHFHYVVSVKTKTKIVRSLAPAHAGMSMPNDLNNVLGR